MKNVISCLALLFFAFGAAAQSGAAKTPAQDAVEKLAQLYGLNATQQADMLKIQERKLRNLAEIGPLKISDPQAYLRKVQAIQLGNNESFERIFNADQKKMLKQQQVALREKKAVVFKEMKTAGSAQQEIDKKMLELDLEAL
ncbi:MAG: hypothetical protein HY842_05600 [Bacteroidetes bacterium]|nr:hypothetical protein [Bacteroidota bacterium]